MSVGTRDASEVMVAVSGDVYIAPVGTPLPTLVREPLHLNFFQVGLVGEDGVQMAVAPTVEEHNALQEMHPIRRILAEQRIALTFDMLQWNAENVVWAFGNRGSVVEYAPSQWRYDFPGDDSSVDERSIVIDWLDAERTFRLVFSRGTVLGGLTTTMRRGALKRLPVGFDVLLANDGGSPGYLFLSSSPTAPPEGAPAFGDGLMGDGTMG